MFLFIIFILFIIEHLRIITRKPIAIMFFGNSLICAGTWVLLQIMRCYGEGDVRYDEREKFLWFE